MKNENKKLKILLAEDDTLALNALSNFLVNLGHEVITKNNAIDVLDTIEKEREFDIIITDVCMPNLSGLDLLKQLNFRKIDIPVVLITAYADLEIAIEALKQNAFDLLRKPIDLNELEASVSRLSKSQNQNSDVQEKVICNEIENDFISLSMLASVSSHHLNQPIVDANSGLRKIEQVWTRMVPVSTHFQKDHPELANYLAEIEKEIFQSISNLKNSHKRILNIIEENSTFFDKIFIEYLENNQLSLRQLSEIVFNIHKDKTDKEIQFESDKDLSNIIIKRSIIEFIEAFYDIIHVVFSSFPVEQRKKKIQLNYMRTDEYIEIMVISNGNSLNEFDIDNIFSLYYETSAESKKFHYGLYNANAFAKSISGKLSIKNISPQGFQIDLLIPNGSVFEFN
ncbi:MAG: response regulator [Candidatus Coatesbacteria bacterium]|nr:response regulator [Candidatus Coatesbacteria bacterium]